MRCAWSPVSPRKAQYALLAESAHEVVGESDAKGYRPGAPNPFQFWGTNVFEGAKRKAQEGSAHQGDSPFNYMSQVYL